MLIRDLRYYSIENPMESVYWRAFPHWLECDKRYEIDFLYKKRHEWLAITQVVRNTGGMSFESSKDG